MRGRTWDDDRATRKLKSIHDPGISKPKRKKAYLSQSHHRTPHPRRSSGIGTSEARVGPKTHARYAHDIQDSYTEKALAVDCSISARVSVSIIERRSTAVLLLVKNSRLVPRPYVQQSVENRGCSQARSMHGCRSKRAKAPEGAAHHLEQLEQLPATSLRCTRQGSRVVVAGHLTAALPPRRFRGALERGPRRRDR